MSLKFRRRSCKLHHRPADSLRRSGPRSAHTGRRLWLERLEDRTLLSTVSWIGGSGSWTDAAHWSGGVLPGPTDDVEIINVASDITVTLYGPQTINSLTCQETLWISSAGSLDLAANSEVASLTLYNGGTVSGTGDLTVTKKLDWVQGTMRGPGTTVVAPNAEAFIGTNQMGFQSQVLDGRTLDLLGSPESTATATWHGAGDPQYGGEVQGSAAFKV